MPKLKPEFYLQGDVLSLAQQLLGKVLYTHLDGVVTSGKIVETEAYNGREDKASHAYGGRYTNRTQTMYKKGGITYVYLCYGIHHLLNVVTGPENTPQAVLIRGIEPLEGLEQMLNRRKMTRVEPRVSAGPGALSQALGVNMKHNALDLSGNDIWIQDEGILIQNNEIIASPRVGVAYAAEHALLPWRFSIKSSTFVSNPKPEKSIY